MQFTGTWHIYEMEMWDEDYFNMELQAYLRSGLSLPGKATMKTIRHWARDGSE